MEVRARAAASKWRRWALLAVLRPGLVALVVLLASLLSPAPSSAIFHLAVIDEVMSGFNGDPDVQYVEIRMDFPNQNFVNDTRLTAFNADGSSFTVLLLLDHDVPNDGIGVRWLMATQAFADLTGVAPDFIFPPGLLTPSGMVCWGAPNFAPPSGTWNPAFPFLYTDCVAYGGYSGGNPLHPPPSDLPPGDGMQSLQRTQGPSGGGDLADFVLADPSPENNAGVVAELVASVGGFAIDLGGAGGRPLETSDSSRSQFGVAVAAAAAAALGGLGGTAWYAKRRRLR